ncbi:MAG: hypothetical protein IKT39_00205 [Clostridia bacterium]|nr:hypothetical protein [Clostridia bacterium]
MKNTKKLTFAAISCALSLALLYIASLVHTGTLAFQYAVGLLVMLTVSKSGIIYGTMSYAATCILCFILLPDKANAISYLLFFGSIPLVKFFAEKFPRIVEWIVKIIFMNIFICGLYFIFRAVMLTAMPLVYMWLAALITAIAYDLLLSFGFSFASRYFDKIS